MASDDRRIQLREGIHQLVAAAAAARCVSPASLVSVVMYDYLRTCGELTVTLVPKSPGSVREVLDNWKDD